MKISASVYSSKSQSLPEIIKDLDVHGADLFHIDCNDDLSVFDDIAEIKQLSKTPVDLHIISSEPEKFFTKIEDLNVNYVTFQFENLKDELIIPDNISAKLGLAITSNTDISVFEHYAEKFDFILFMTTTPGQSGGVFDKSNFRRIRQFRQQFPDKKIHVDGGVNGEVSFILRIMCVYASVSGSYLMTSESMGAAMLNLKTHEVDSHFQVKDFMREADELPLLKLKYRKVIAILK